MTRQHTKSPCNPSRRKTNSEKEPHPITKLSFVEDTPDGRNFWAVKPTGDYAEDCRLGTDLGIELLAYERQHKHDWGGPAVLNLVLVAISEECEEDQKGIMVGLAGILCTALGPFLAIKTGHDQLVGIVARRRQEYEDFLAGQAQERSDHARHAANVRWGRGNGAAS